MIKITIGLITGILMAGACGSYLYVKHNSYREAFDFVNSADYHPYTCDPKVCDPPKWEPPIDEPPFSDPPRQVPVPGTLLLLGLGILGLGIRSNLR